MSNNIALRLQKLRKENNLSQEALAEKLGISRQTVSEWECGDITPDLKNLMALSQLYGISVDELIGNSFNKNAQNESADFTDADDETDTSKRKRKKQNSEPPLFPNIQSDLLKFPMFIVIPVIYIILGLFFKLWHPAWLMFIGIPLYYQLCHAFGAKNQKSFLLRLPIVPGILLVFLCSGFFLGLWKYAWILFLCIPIYYWIVGFMKK
jgi:transcriptional regulator with XRE-family HTH domain